MADPKPQRCRFQFSLRKMMLWTAVWAIYLGIVRLLGMWLPIAVCLTIYLAILLFLRLNWGQDRGVILAFRVTGLTLACVGATIIIWGFATGGFFAGFASVLFSIAVCLLGLYLGLWGFLLVHAVASALDSIDNRMQTKTPKDA